MSISGLAYTNAADHVFVLEHVRLGLWLMRVRPFNHEARSLRWARGDFSWTANMRHARVFGYREALAISGAVPDEGRWFAIGRRIRLYDNL